jgi:hypothetical protein
MFWKRFFSQSRRQTARRSTCRLWCEPLEDRLAPTVFTVINTQDSGPGSLRQAIINANASPVLTPAPDEIHFNIAGPGVHTIAPRSALPTITKVKLIIDGYTQPGASPNSLAVGNNAVLRVQLVGTEAGDSNGLVIQTDQVRVRGLVINSFQRAGVLLTDGADLNSITGNFIGTDATGTAAAGNTHGVRIERGSNSNGIGGKDPASRNLISGNIGATGGGAGVLLGPTGSSNWVGNNYIGTNAAGTAALANHRGVLVDVGDDNTIKGNLISGNDTGIAIQGVDPLTRPVNNSVRGNYIGTNAAGTAAVPNHYGVVIAAHAHQNEIGGSNSVDENLGNVISGNSLRGVWISDPSAIENKVFSNRIGTDAGGTAALGNGSEGIWNDGFRTQIGAPPQFIDGVWHTYGNLISGNAGTGVFLDGYGEQVQANSIGTDITGNFALGNENGVRISTVNSIVGGNTAGAGNLISGNRTDGVRIHDFDTTGNWVSGNRIGTDHTGRGPLGNGLRGVYISGGANGNNVGGTLRGAGNVIAFNGQRPTRGIEPAGVHITSDTSGVGNAVLANSIHSNHGLGIDLGPWGVTVNDSKAPPYDEDSGANGLQNYPVLTSATSSDGKVTIQGTLHTNANSNYRLDFYGNNSGDPSGHGEGQTHLGHLVIPVGPSGTFSFTISFPGSAAYITATATDPDFNTSEFSAWVAVKDGGSMSALASADGGAANARAGLLDDLSAPAPAPYWLPAPRQSEYGSAPFGKAPDTSLAPIAGLWSDLPEISYPSLAAERVWESPSLLLLDDIIAAFASIPEQLP